MLIVDDILLFPYRGMMWIFNEIRVIAEEELSGEADRIRSALTELYMQLETGRITEAEFDAQEVELLARLDALESDDEGGWDNDAGDETDVEPGSG